MAKRQSLYQTLLSEAVDEFNEWLLRVTQHQDTFKYCIKCRSRKTLPGIKFCKHCSTPPDESRKVQRAKSRKSKATRKKPPKVKICSEPGCTELCHARGKCKRHYNTLIMRIHRAKKRNNNHSDSRGKG